MAAENLWPLLGTGRPAINTNMDAFQCIVNAGLGLITWFYTVLTYGLVYTKRAHARLIVVFGTRNSKREVLKVGIIYSAAYTRLGIAISRPALV